MAFRRFASSRGRSFNRSSRFRFRRRENVVRRPIRWSRCNFYLPVLHLHADQDTRNVVTTSILAWVPTLEAAMGVTAGPTMAQLTRKLVIGGIKFTTQRRLVTATDPSLDLTPDDWRHTTLRQVDTKVLLVSDGTNMDAATSTIAPDALLPNYFTNTFPVASVAEPQDTDNRFPRRIHWQDFKRFDGSLDNYMAVPFPGDPPDGEGHVWTKSLQTTVNAASGANLRLRLRLQDDEVLAFQHASFIPQSAAEDSQIEVQFITTGTLWYRVDI